MFPHQHFTDEIVKPGRWFDHGDGRHRLLLKDSTAPYIYAVVVFFITLSTKNVSTIVWRLLGVVGEKSKRAVLERDVGTATETTSLIAAGSQLNNGTISTSSTIPRTHENGEGTAQPPKSTRVIVSAGRESLRNTWRYILNGQNPHKTWTALCCFILLGFQFGILALGYWSSPLMQAGRSALWFSENCGLWEFPSDDATNEEATRNDVILRQKEARAGEYAKYCYEPWSSNQPLPVYCNFFAHRNISFEESRPYRCPFRNHSVCAGSQVATFDTGKLPATDLGINQETPYMFRRTATCVPLNTNEPYVQEEDRNGTRAFKYYYGKWVGSDDDDEPLFDTEGDPFEWTVPTYDVSAFTTGSEAGDWAPIDDLNPGKDQALTLLFVRPLQIYYLGPSRDAVFPTDGILQYPDGDRWHVKSDPKAGVLACVEKTELCDPTGETCWPASNRYDSIRDRGYWLMKLALKDATLYDSISLRLGTALVAQEMISQQLSLALPDDHWRTEARRLFATSLALAQIKAWSIGSGEDHVHEQDYGWENQTPLEAKESGGLCGLLKFKSTGYTDIDLLNFVLLLVLPWPLTALLSTRWETVCSWFRWRSRAPKQVVESGLEDSTDEGATLRTEINGDEAPITSNNADGASTTSRRRLVHHTTTSHAVQNGPTSSIEPSTLDHSTMKIEAADETLVAEIVGKPVWFIIEMMSLAIVALLNLVLSLGKKQD